MPNTLSTYSFSRLITGRFFLFLGLLVLGYGVFFASQSQAGGKRILYVVDTSLSMAVEDAGSDEQGIMHSRLELAQDLMQAQKGQDTSQAIVSYARTAALILPFSSDRAAFQDAAQSLSVVDIFWGSDISTALTLVDTLYRGNTTPMTIVVISDGGNTGDSTLPPLPPLSRLIVVWVGTDAGGKIPLGYNLEGERRYKLYEGKEVVAAYEAKFFSQLADHYRASVFRILGRSDIADITEKIRDSTEESSFFVRFSLVFPIGILAIILWLFIHPYTPQLWKSRNH